MMKTIFSLMTRTIQITQFYASDMASHWRNSASLFTGADCRAVIEAAADEIWDSIRDFGQPDRSYGAVDSFN